jgi:hypothetical protein
MYASRRSGFWSAIVTARKSVHKSLLWAIGAHEVVPHVGESDCSPESRSDASATALAGAWFDPLRHQVLRAVPVLPKPPVPRAVSSTLATSCQRARTTGASTAWAMRAPRSTTNGASPVFSTITCSSPR